MAIATAKRLVILALLPLSAGLSASSSAVPTPSSTTLPASRLVTPAQWHRQRRAAILEAYPQVGSLTGTKDARSVPVLALCNGLQVAAAIGSAHLPIAALVPLALLGGGTLSLWQFAILHDVKHGTAALPKGVSANEALFWGSLPSVFGYYLYLRYGHLSHHRTFGEEPLRSLFDSASSNFEDGDALFVAHRQHLADDRMGERVGFFGPDDVGGLGLSISRFFYSLGWRGEANSGSVSSGLVSSGSVNSGAGSNGAGAEGHAEGNAEWNAEGNADERGLGAVLQNGLVFTFSMAFERLALCVNDKVVALVGRNFFFPHKPDDFHAVCAKYSRASALLHATLLFAAGPHALLWLYLSEIGWQLPFHPASAMFVSNHPSLEAPVGGSVGGSVVKSVGKSVGGSVGEGLGCQPTASVYLDGPWDGRWYDWLCCFSNYHTEHHDFPDVPAFELRKLRDMAPTFYEEEALAGCRDGWAETMRRSFARREFYACAGAMADVRGETKP